MWEQRFFELAGYAFCSVNRFSASNSSLFNLSLKQFLKCESFSASICAFVPKQLLLNKYFEINQSCGYQKRLRAASCLICFAVGLLS